MKGLEAALRGKDREIKVAGLPVAAWPWMVANLKHKGAVLVVVPEAGAVEGVAAGLRALVGEGSVCVFPGWDVQPYDRVGPSVDVMGARAAAVERLQGGGNVCVVASVAALGVRVPAGEHVGQVWEVRAGDSVDLREAAEALVGLGYTREEVVQDVGMFAIRGGILDVWPAGEGDPVRLELFGDEVESLRRFDPATQKSMGAVDGVRVGAAGLVVLDEGRVGTFRAKYRDLFVGGTEDSVYVAVSEGLAVPEAGQLLPLFYEEPLASLPELLPEGCMVVLPENFALQAEGWEQLVQGAYTARREGMRKGSDGDVVRAIPPEMLYVAASELVGGLGRFRQVVVNVFDDGQGVHAGIRAHGYHSHNRHGAAVAAARDVTARAGEGWSVLLTAASEAGLAQFLRALEGEGAPAARLVPGINVRMGSGVAAVVSGISAGWVDSEAKVFVLAEGDVFGTRLGAGTRKRRRSAEEVIAHFSELREGDFVVHEANGIGRFGGLVTLDSGGVRQDFLKLFYAGDDRLFVPVENLDLLSRYKGSDAGGVVLDRLGTGGWEVRKAKVKEDLMAMAAELLATAAAREEAQRTPITRVAGLYDEFCGGFPHPLTDDQVRVMEEVEDDLANGVPMDRLVVGDVGFGKTEVALRTAFLVAASGRQVAVVCPTTLLARQHYEVFRERFHGFPMKVARLSRLVAAAEAKQVKDGLAKGEIDVVVGTHALLSKDMKFARLGLVVIDEEQRFGVAHKERLKGMRAEVDVLTLTATPIPRTLQMAVGGVRQLSLITTPPVDRQAVQTFVLGWDNVTLKGAITRELVRGGQVYFVAPHVEDLGKLEDDLHALVPEARVGVAHGQMAEGALEAVMEGFYEGNIDILLATTIIESGLDVPRANTIVVYRADRFGLAQLYQLRGRVGRSTAKAFAYMLLPQGPLGGDAAKRLQILQRLDGLGAGFTLASYDMDLRGFGNLLGKQQSGNIRDIGFELYAKMLKDAVEERKRRSVAKKAVVEEEDLRASSVTLKLGISYLIPEHYVPDVAVRLQLYRRLAGVQDEAAWEEFREELVDRFGAMPAEVEALLAVVQLRNRAAALNVAKVEVGEKGVVVGFEGGRFVNPEGLVRLIGRLAGVVSIRPAGRGQELVWHRRVGADVVRGVGAILAELESVAG